MMPPEGFRRIYRRLIHQTAWKVHAREVITAILHKPRPMGQLGRVSQGQFANGSVVGVGREK
jgi:hypothetical protein